MFNIPLTTILEQYSKDTYDTPVDTPRFVSDRLLLNTRWGFYLNFFETVVKSSRSARKGTYDDTRWIQSSYDIFKKIEGCGGRFHIKGLDNLRNAKEPVIIVSNHMSTLETMIFPGIIAPFMKVTFVVKDKLVKGPIFGPVMRSRNPIVVGRKNAFEDFRVVMDQGEERLKEGYSLIIFPQSTRTLIFNPEQFNTMGVKLAKKVGVKVIPTAIQTDWWGESKIMKGFGPIHRDKPINMVFGEPIEVKGNGKEEHKQTIEFITSHLSEWGVKIEPKK